MNPTQEELKNWIQEWKTCKCSELIDTFHFKDQSQNDNGETVEVLSRRSSYAMPQDTWAEIRREVNELGDKLYHLRIHMAVKPGVEAPEFRPILQLVSTNGTSSLTTYFAFNPLNAPVIKDPALSVGDSDPSTISAQLRLELQLNWIQLHPSLITDQFESLKTELALNGTRHNVQRARVNYFTYDQATSKSIMDKFENWKAFRFHLGVNPSFDALDRPSFAPVLSIEYNIPEISSGEFALRNQGGTGTNNHEYANPCPHICQP